MDDLIDRLENLRDEPRYTERLNTEIHQKSVSDAIAAIQGGVKAPCEFDPHTAVADGGRKVDAGSIPAFPTNASGDTAPAPDSGSLPAVDEGKINSDIIYYLSGFSFIPQRYCHIAATGIMNLVRPHLRQPAPDSGDCRAAFEAWCGDGDKYKDGSYKSTLTAYAWDAFQAAWGLNARPADAPQVIPHEPTAGSKCPTVFGAVRDARASVAERWKLRCDSMKAVGADWSLSREYEEQSEERGREEAGKVE